MKILGSIAIFFAILLVMAGLQFFGGLMKGDIVIYDFKLYTNFQWVCQIIYWGASLFFGLYCGAAAYSDMKKGEDQL